MFIHILSKCETTAQDSLIYYHLILFIPKVRKINIIF